jgi:hypothetical protein
MSYTDSLLMGDGSQDTQRSPFVWQRSARAGTAIGAASLVAIWTPGAGRRIRVLGGTICPLAASIIILNEGTTGGTDGAVGNDFLDLDFVGTAYAAVPFAFGGNGKLFAKDEVLMMYSSAATSVVYSIWGTEESATTKV